MSDNIFEEIKSKSGEIIDKIDEKLGDKIDDNTKEQIKDKIDELATEENIEKAKEGLTGLFNKFKK